ncbi:class II glutamine amidotransferase [Mycolicibacterium conceptionense]|uniref:class II glutamine amidotransferase n=1 Tax=Mycolicibacterium conceptionense TaxID=451644 RepID=UPI00096C5C77|nr:class II glutamine amidotransferase [Mycolicibacterium conceptionense]OMB87405.1 class II glutamine amidotransferase [Mycolicibacterium conceptionense]
MCRLFGLHAGRHLVPATFWLLDAPDNLAEQSRRNPDGTGLGVFGPDGLPVIHKEPVAAWQDSEFATEAHDVTATTFIAHVRYASTGSLDPVNTHPFLQDGRIFAHNGVVEGLDVLDDRIRELAVADLVKGQTDSERVFALITASARARGGDIGAGIVEAVGWLADNVPIYAVNLLLSTATDMWALRYPDTHDLYMLDRRRPSQQRLRLRSPRIRAESDQLTTQPSVVFASEPMDDEDWRPIAPRELVHVDPDLRIETRVAFPKTPRHLLHREDLSAKAAASQHG